jgi:transposase InsO family protein
LDDFRAESHQKHHRHRLFVIATATFRLVYVFVVMELETRRILHFNVTQHPTAEWTLQQFRECVSGDEGYRFVILDRDRIYSQELDQALKSLGLTVLKTPYKCPQANAFCERLSGSARRECFDFMIPLNETHIRQTFKSWASHYNRGRPHSSLGPRMPDNTTPKAELQVERHCLPKDCRVRSISILGGLHHEYQLEKTPA